MNKVNIFFLAIIFTLTLIILPFSAMATEMANDKTLEEVTRKAVVKKCKGKIDEEKFAKFLFHIKTSQSGDFCYDCKEGIILGGRRGKCRVRVSKDGPNIYIVK